MLSFYKCLEPLVSPYFALSTAFTTIGYSLLLEASSILLDSVMPSTPGFSFLSLATLSVFFTGYYYHLPGL